MSVYNPFDLWWHDVAWRGFRSEEGFACSIFAPPHPEISKRRPTITKRGEKNRTRSSPTGPAEQEEGGSLRTQSQYQLIQIIVVCGGDMFEGQCPSTPRNSKTWSRPTEGWISYRPRSASSLLILLRAILNGVWIYRNRERGWKVEFEEWFEVLHTRPVSERKVFTMIEKEYRYYKIEC